MARSMRLCLVGLAVLAVACPASAEDYPTRTVTMIVPCPAGGPTDQLARVLAPKFTKQLGQNVIV